MSDENTKASAPAPPPAAKKGAKKPRPKINRRLTPEQRAEAAALWQAGSVTLDDLSKKFGKRPENFSRLFKQMGIAKGSAVAKAEAAAADAIANSVAKRVSEELQRIEVMKDQHFKMSSAIAKIAFAEITQARQAGTKIENLKDTMLTLKLAGEIIGTARKEQYALLRVEEHDKDKELEDLPELEVRELSQAQINEMQAAPSADEIEDLGLGDVIEDDEGGA